MYVCICHAVTANDIFTAFDAGARCARSISKATQAGTGCGSCLDRLDDMVKSVGGAHPHPAPCSAPITGIPIAV